MAGVVFGAVLAAALLHASWNALAKAIPDQRVAPGLFGVVGLVTGAVGVALLPPPAVAAWPFLAASVVLQTGYVWLLVYAYRDGEFGQIYPLARGLPPLLVTVISLTVLEERLTAAQLAGVVLVSLALIGLVFSGGRPRFSGGRPRLSGGRPGAGSGLGLAAATGVVIAGYTLVDGVGVREAERPLSYLAWLFLLHSALMLATSGARAGRGFPAAVRRSAVPGLLAGVLSLVAYGIVVWAQSRAPLPLVSALRETSLLFAGAIGTLVFREPFRVGRLVATAAAVAGIALLAT